MGMCCNERDRKLALRNVDCPDFHSAKKTRIAPMFYVSQLILLKYSKHAYFKTMPNLNTGDITRVVHRFRTCAYAPLHTRYTHGVDLKITQNP